MWARNCWAFVISKLASNSMIQTASQDLLASSSASTWQTHKSNCLIRSPVLTLKLTRTLELMVKSSRKKYLTKIIETTKLTNLVLIATNWKKQILIKNNLTKNLSSFRLILVKLILRIYNRGGKRPTIPIKVTILHNREEVELYSITRIIVSKILQISTHQSKSNIPRKFKSTHPSNSRPFLHKLNERIGSQVSGWAFASVL